jgi:hypothetical protein
MCACEKRKKKILNGIRMEEEEEDGDEEGIQDGKVGWDYFYYYHY